MPKNIITVIVKSSMYSLCFLNDFKIGNISFIDENYILVLLKLFLFSDTYQINDTCHSTKNYCWNNINNGK